MQGASVGAPGAGLDFEAKLVVPWIVLSELDALKADRHQLGLLDSSASPFALAQYLHICLFPRLTLLDLSDLRNIPWPYARGIIFAARMQSTRRCPWQSQDAVHSRCKIDEA